MNTPCFADTLAIERGEDGLWRGEADRRFSNGADPRLAGQFGGWVAAVLLKAAQAALAPKHRPRALSVHFLNAVRAGPLDVRVAPLRQGRTVSFWQSELSQGEVRAHAVLTAGVDRPDPHARLYAQPPQAPGPDAAGLLRFTPPTPFGQSVEARWVDGMPFQDGEAARSVFWSRIAAAARVDAAALALLSDFMPPRIFFAAKAFVPSSTLSLSLYLHASAEELQAVGEGFILVEVIGRRIAAGYWDHTASFWSADGALLATSEQLALHRG